MREAIGATWIFVIVIVFIIVFTGYLAFSVNYAKAFAVKDTIVDTLEKYNGPGQARDKSSFNSTGPVLDEIAKKLKNINYNSKGRCNLVARTLTNLENVDDYSFRKKVMGVTGNKGYLMENPISNRYNKTESNYCIIRLEQKYIEDWNLGFSTYLVATFFSIDIDIINIIKVHFNFFVTGQTKNIAYPNDGFLMEVY